MKKIISKREYDTETAQLIKKHTEGTFGDPAGYEETLYKTEKGYFFLYTNGGEALGDSYKRIFANYLVELYMAQRKYKDALTIKSEYGYV